MGYAKTLRITNTYRNSQELIDIAGGFVQKNSTQIKKQLISPKHLENPVVIETFDDSSKPMKALAERIEEIIGKILKLHPGAHPVLAALRGIGRLEGAHTRCSAAPLRALLIPVFRLEILFSLLVIAHARDYTRRTQKSQQRA